jgi:hypothetical protein
MYTAISWGRRLYGAVDRMPGGVYVGTMCGHFCYLPLIPHGSMIVTGKDGNQYQGVQIPLSLKSWAIGWAQVILTGLMVMVGMMIFGFLVVSCDNDPNTRTQIDVARDRVMLKWTAGTEAVLGALMVATTVIPGVGRASPARAKELAQILAAAQAEAKPANRRMGPYGRYV